MVHVSPTQRLSPSWVRAPLVAALVTLAACGTPSPRDFGGAWKPINRFDAQATEIPLDLPYTYFAAPMDRTLKAMMARWAADTGMVLDYQLHSDFTLVRELASLRTAELGEALNRLTAAYAPQGLQMRRVGDRLVVVALPPGEAGPARD